MGKDLNKDMDNFEKTHKGSISDELDSFDRTFSAPPETMENKLGLNDYVYPALHASQDALSAVALPLTLPIASVGYAANKASNYIQGKPQEEAPNPLEHPIDFAGQYATTDAINRTLPPDQRSQPLADTVQSSPLTEKFKEQFPNMYEAVHNISDRNIKSAAMDAALIPELPKIIPKVPTMTLETAADYVRSLAKNSGQLETLEANGKIYALAKMVQQEPEKYLHPFQPNKIYSYLMGSLDKENATRNYDQGAIRQATNAQDQFLNSVHENNQPISRADLQQAAIQKLNSRGRIEEGLSTNAENIIKRNIPVVDNVSNEEPSNYSTDTRRFANTLKEPYTPGVSNSDIPAKNLAGMAMEQASRDAENAAISRASVTPEQVQEYKDRNSYISKMLEMRDLTQGNLVSDNGQIGKVAAPTIGGSLKHVIMRAKDRYIKPVGSQLGSGAINSIPVAAERSVPTNITRRPNSIEDASNIMNKQMLNTFRVPRSTEDIISNKDLVRAKLQKDFGDHAVQGFDSAATQEEISSLMSSLSQIKPDSFQPDSYGRFDGVINNPILKQRAMEQILNNQPSALEGAKQMQLLLNGNKYYGN